MSRNSVPAPSGARWWEYHIDDEGTFDLAPRRARFEDDPMRNSRASSRARTTGRVAARRHGR